MEEGKQQFATLLYLSIACKHEHDTYPCKLNYSFVVFQHQHQQTVPHDLKQDMNSRPSIQTKAAVLSALIASSLTTTHNNSPKTTYALRPLSV